ncbi:DUF1127 domain-containing protein [Agrobacterium vitis]
MPTMQPPAYIFGLFSPIEEANSRSTTMPFARRIREAISARRAIRELLAMDDHILKDYGILRRDIERRVRGR